MGSYPGLGFSPSKALSSPFLFSSLNPRKTKSLTQGHKLVNDTASVDFQAKHLARLRWEPPDQR